MSEEALDVDLQRASAAWPRPVRVDLVAPDPGWPAEAARWAERLRGVGEVHHVGATAVPGLAAVAQLDLLVVGADPDGEAVAVALEARDLTDRGGGLWRRPPLPDDTACPTAVEVRLLRAGDPAVEPVLRFRDLLRIDDEAARRYTGVRRGLAGDYGDLAAYRRAKGPVIAALLRG